MIFSNINCDYKSQGLHPVLVEVFDYLKENDLSKKEVGVTKLKGDDIFLQIIETSTEDIEKRRPESHREYLDVQFVIKGEEKIGITRLLEEYEVDEYIDERDLIFYKEVTNEGYIHATEGCISVFFPEDVHRPQIAVNEPEFEKKAVVKVRASLLR